MRFFPFALIAAAALAGPAAAQTTTARDRDALDEARRQVAMQQQRDAETRVQRAREKCIANRGTDCDTIDGLSEWLLLDRSRAEAVLDRIVPGSASTGSSNVPR